MGSRRHKRVSMKLPVKIWGMDASGQPFVKSANTVDISNRGAKVSGATCFPAIGEVVGIQYKNLKARFRVVWVGKQDAANQGQIGLESVEDRDIWGVPLVPNYADTFKREAVPSVSDSFPCEEESTSERRLASRWLCEGGIQFWEEGTDFPTWARVTDVSLGGCYVEMMMPMKAGSHLKMILNLRDLKLPAAGVVRTSHPGIGMGVMFTEMAPEHREQLHRLVVTIEGKSPYPPEMATVATKVPAPTPQSFPELTLSPQACKAVLQQIMGWFHGQENLSRGQFILLVNSKADAPEKAQAEGTTTVSMPQSSGIM